MINKSKTVSALAALTITGLAFNLAAGDKPVKIFILAGQSNMEGQGLIELDGQRAEGYKTRGLSEEAIARKRRGALENLVKDPNKAEAYKHIVDKDGLFARICR